MRSVDIISYYYIYGSVKLLFVFLKILNYGFVLW